MSSDTERSAITEKRTPWNDPRALEILERKMPLALAKIQGKDAEDLNLSLNELQYMFFLGFHPDMVQSAAEELLQLDVIYK